MADIDYSKFLDHISLDCVIFGFHENQLKVLLMQMKYTKEWALPGGFMKEDETLEEAAERVLKERTSLDNIFLKQFHVFSDPNRSKENPAVKDLKESGANPNIEWFSQRFVSVGFYALVDYEKVSPTPDYFSDHCEWKTLEEIDTLMMDHREILNKALETLRLQLSYQPIGYNLLPEKFTMPELQKLYETLLGKKLDRRNFQRKILSYKILNKLDERKQGGAYKAPYLYEFNLENYNKALKEGFSGSW
ncbi:MAG TPA: NUDIX hydrolase [Mariniphaga anaerophila]|uniref:NUDIX hydrolase n=1 Tax=Mariniphaga anaerophila TaxID=1484053 RepID=A0A831PRH5_9BACT|nr:NUDIX hydrolase [Mariniphaga anaerophila]